jgi:diguanylate cyclase (GGDEF)-like protein
MDDAGKSKAQLIEELQALRARVEELEHAQAEHRQAERKSLADATHDPSTGLFNREHFMEHLAPSVRSARRYGYPLSVCLCCLPGLRAVNRTKGRQVTEELLAEFGDLIRDELRGDDIAGRYGEEEFCIVLPHTLAANAAMAIERVRARLDRVAAGVSLKAAFGVADLAPDDATEKDLLLRADRALCKARDAGGNRVVIQLA